MKVPLASILVYLDPCAPSPPTRKIDLSIRHNLFLRGQLRGHKCRDQYVVPVSIRQHQCLAQQASREISLISTTVANEQGSFTTPSFVSFTDQERLIGEAAKNQAAMNPRNTVFDIK